MMVIGRAGIVATGVLAIAALVSSAAAKDPNELSGTWALRLIDAGKPTVQENGHTMTFADGKVDMDGKKVFSYRIDSSKDPKELDFIGFVETKEHAKINTPGIYKIEADQLTICLGFSGPLGGAEIPGQRPSDFNPGLGKVIFVLDREK